MFAERSHPWYIQTIPILRIRAELQLYSCIFVEVVDNRWHFALLFLVNRLDIQRFLHRLKVKTSPIRSHIACSKLRGHMRELYYLELNKKN